MRVVHTCAMTHSFWSWLIGHDSFICIPGLIRMCLVCMHPVTQSYTRLQTGWQRILRLFFSNFQFVQVVLYSHGIYHQYHVITHYAVLIVNPMGKILVRSICFSCLETISRLCGTLSSLSALPLISLPLISLTSRRPLPLISLTSRRPLPLISLTSRRPLPLIWLTSMRACRNMISLTSALPVIALTYRLYVSSPSL